MEYLYISTQPRTAYREIRTEIRDEEVWRLYDTDRRYPPGDLMFLAGDQYWIMEAKDTAKHVQACVDRFMSLRSVVLSVRIYTTSARSLGRGMVTRIWVDCGYGLEGSATAVESAQREGVVTFYSNELDRAYRDLLLTYTGRTPALVAAKAELLLAGEG